MPQRIFAWSGDESPSFAAFIVGDNAELFRALHNDDESCRYVWGASGTGKTFLARAWACEHGERALFVGANKTPLFASGADDIAYAAVDDVDLCDEAQAAALFTRFNEWQAAGVRMLFTASVPPARLPLRVDVRTRMASSAVYEIKALSDEDKIRGLRELTRARQMYVDDAVFPYLLRRHSRDLSVLAKLLQGFDDYAVQEHRRMTLPLLQRFLRNERP